MLDSYLWILVLVWYLNLDILNGHSLVRALFLRRSPENYPRTHSEHVPNPVFISFLRCTLVLSVHRVTSHGNEIQNEAITAGCASKAVWYGTVTDADRVALLIGQGWGFWITAACACEVGTHSFDVGMSWWKKWSSIFSWHLPENLIVQLLINICKPTEVMDTKDKGRSAEQCPQDTTCFRYEIHHLIRLSILWNPMHFFIHGHL